MKSVISVVILISIIFGASSYKIYYPRGKTMESVVHLSGSLFLMSDYVTGNVMMTDTKSRQTFTVVTAPANRTIQGLEFVKKGQLILTCGGGAFLNKFIQDRMEAESPNVENVVFPQVPTGIHIYNLSTGDPYITCQVPGAQVINDVVMDRQERYAYFSDTRSSFMYRLDVRALYKKTPECIIKYIQLPKKDFEGDFLFKAAGLAYYKNNKAEGVIIANFSPKTYHFYDVKTGETYLMGSSTGSVDGFRLVRNRCLISALNLPAVYKHRVTYNEMTKKLEVAFKGQIEDTTNELIYPTALAIVGRNMIVANQNTTLLGETGQLYAAVVRIPDWRNLC